MGGMGALDSGRYAANAAYPSFVAHRHIDATRPHQSLSNRLDQYKTS